MPETRACTRCGVKRPLTARYWYRDPSNPLGWTTRCKRCRGAAQAARRRGRGPGRPRKRVPPRPWEPQEDEVLLRLRGKVPPDELAAAVSAALGHKRSPLACAHRGRKLGADGYWPNDVLTASAFAALLGAERGTVRQWVRDGWLRARPWGRWRLVDRAEQERFLRECDWLYDWHRIRPGWQRTLAETQTRRDPWLRLTRLARYLGLSPRRVRDLVALGLVPHRWHARVILVRASDFPTIRERYRTWRRASDLREGARLVATRLRRPLEEAA